MVLVEKRCNGVVSFLTGALLFSLRVFGFFFVLDDACVMMTQMMRAQAFWDWWMPPPMMLGCRWHVRCQR